ncbi:MAG TPA: FtsX-like permease family protein [Vicinamibacteria bacterium]|nr:FtsX-like permease family protein [Vicinamibacteria bacterium]
MNAARFVLAMAWRESRSSLPRLALLMAAVSAGVAALVSINSFSANLQRSVRQQAQAVHGADLVLGSGNAFSPRAEALLSELRGRAGPGTRLARVARFSGMAYVPRTAGSRLVQVTAVEEGYPFYGTIATDPAGAWGALPRGGGVLVDPSLLTALDARVGDALALGEARLLIRGTVLDFPGDVGLRSAMGPRVFMALSDLGAAGLLEFGARARHEAYLQVPPEGRPEALANRYRGQLSGERVRLRTVADDRESMGESLGRLSRYLGLLALVALLLGGLGVASAVHVLIKRKLDTVAVLRCLGASSSRLLAVYLLQAAAMGLGGSLLGVGAGVLLQVLVPRLLADFLPVDVRFSVSWPSVLAGLGMGLWVAVLFALLPLLAVRRVSPLVLLRRAYEEERRPGRDPLRLVVSAGLGASVVLLSVLQAPDTATGLVFAGGIGAALALFGLAALALTRAVRRFFPYAWPYVWRQGLANLYRPANQTVAVVLALGFGAFLLDTVLVLQGNLLRDLRVDTVADRPNLVLFDIQPDQRAPLEEALRAGRHPVMAAAPIVPMRIAAVKGRAVAPLLATRTSSAGQPPPERWALRREYRSTYRDDFKGGERTVGGAAWAAGSWRSGTNGDHEPVPVSLEAGLAEDLRVGVGDEIVWDVQGRELRTRVVHLREVEWARFEPNFFVVFPEGPLAEAPQSFVVLSRIDDAGVRGRFQRTAIERFPNVTAVDLSQVQQAIERVLGRVSVAIRFMALFSLAAGAVVLMGAVAAGRYQRMREAALLKTLGATRGQLLRILLAEYLSLGALSVLTALALSSLAGWALVRFLFDARFTWPGTGLGLLSLAVLALTVVVGLLNSREVLRKPPLAVLRAE